MPHEQGMVGIFQPLIIGCKKDLEFEVHPQLWKEYRASLGYTRACLLKKKEISIASLHLIRWSASITFHKKHLQTGKKKSQDLKKKEKL